MSTWTDAAGSARIHNERRVLGGRKQGIGRLNNEREGMVARWVVPKVNGDRVRGWWSDMEKALETFHHEEVHACHSRIKAVHHMWVCSLPGRRRVTGRCCQV